MSTYLEMNLREMMGSTTLYIVNKSTGMIREAKIKSFQEATLKDGIVTFPVEDDASLEPGRNYFSTNNKAEAMKESNKIKRNRGLIRTRA